MTHVIYCRVSPSDGTTLADQADAIKAAAIAGNWTLLDGIRDVPTLQELLTRVRNGEFEAVISRAGGAR